MTSDTFDLGGKTAIITGSTYGIGLAAASSFVTGHNFVVDGGMTITDWSWT